MQTASSILVATGEPLQLVDLDVPALKPGQVLVEIAFSGLCHTIVQEARGNRGEDRFLPHCLGHEGSGTVLETGEGVTKVAPGDAVLLSWKQGAGANVPGTVYDWDGQAVNAGGITTLQHVSVISENRLFPIPDGLSLADAALLGCTLSTGFGAVLNTGQAKKGQSCAVFGCGGVGLSALMAAALADCETVIAVDICEESLVRAKAAGATHMVNPRQGDTVAQILEIVPGGLDLAIEVVGSTETMNQALLSVRDRGGSVVVVGNAPIGQKLEIDPFLLNRGRRLMGTWGGDNEPDRDFEKYCKLLLAGRIDLTPFSPRKYALADINQALDDLEKGGGDRPLIDMGVAGKA